MVSSLDLSQNVDNSRGSQLSQLQLFPRVKQPERQALPPYIYTPDIITAIHVKVTGLSPAHLKILNKYGTLLEFKAEVILSTVIMKPSHNIQWYGFPVMVSGKISIYSGL